VEKEAFLATIQNQSTLHLKKVNIPTILPFSSQGKFVKCVIKFFTACKNACFSHLTQAKGIKIIIFWLLIRQADKFTYTTIFVLI
jgi:hypothetical protein